MENPVRAVHRFEDRPVTTLRYKDRPAWIAREVGEALGYSQSGKRFATRITGEWASEFRHDQDYAVLTGSEAALVRQALGAEGTDSVPLRSNRGVVVLFESGLYLALAKTGKPAGVRFRRFLADEVMPQLARTGRYEPEDGQRQVGLPLVPAGAAQARQAETGLVRVEREQRLAAKQELDRRKFESGALRQTVRALAEAEQIDPVTRLAYEVVAAEMPELRPVLHERWQSPTQIAQAAGVSVQAVGRLISRLALRGAEGLSRQVINKARGSDRTVFTYVYNDRAVAQIRAALDAPRGAE
jgi:prophage antirepressor-like protein